MTIFDSRILRLLKLGRTRAETLARETGSSLDEIRRVLDRLEAAEPETKK